MIKLYILFIILLIGSALPLKAQFNSHIVYEADREGNAIEGSLDSLIQYVTRGFPIRVGWKMNMIHPENQRKIEMQHWTDGGFVTYLDGHVFAQVRGIFQQGPSISDPPGVFLASDIPNSWVGIVGTTGSLIQKFTMDEEMLSSMRATMSEEEMKKWLKDMESSRVYTMWAVMK